MKTVSVFCGPAICLALLLTSPAAADATVELTLDCVVTSASRNAAALAPEVRLFVKVDSKAATIIKGVHEFELTYDRDLTLSELTLVAYQDRPKEMSGVRPLFSGPDLPRIGVSRLTGEGYFTFYERLGRPLGAATAQWELIIVRMQCERVANEHRVF